MPSPKAPSMPTEKQVREAFEVVKALCPGVRIKVVGPEGVAFDYPDAGAVDASKWAGKPFTGAK